MPRFTDGQQREWELQIDGPLCFRIREECDPDFLKNDFQDDKPSTYARLVNDPVLLCRIIFIMCDKQRVERGITEESFYLGVLGDVIDVATVALKDAIINFIPRRTREMLEVFAKQDQRHVEAMKELVAKLDNPAITNHLRDQLESRIDEILMGQLSATGLQASSASTPEA